MRHSIFEVTRMGLRYNYVRGDVIRPLSLVYAVFDFQNNQVTRMGLHYDQVRGYVIHPLSLVYTTFDFQSNQNGLAL